MFKTYINSNSNYDQSGSKYIGNVLSKKKKKFSFLNVFINCEDIITHKRGETIIIKEKNLNAFCRTILKYLSGCFAFNFYCSTVLFGDSYFISINAYSVPTINHHKMNSFHGREVGSK